MIGIKSYGAYVPRYRIDRNVIYSAMGWLNPAIYMAGEKAVANWDEDSISMAVAAAIDCLNGMERGKIDGLYLATTTPPYMLRQNSGIVAGALDLRSEIRTADFAGSTKSGTSGLLSALDAIKGGGAGNVLVCASDCRTSKPGSAQEHLYGDGAAALLLGNEGVIATLEGHCSVSYDFPDRWRASDERFEHAWEDRFIRDEGYVYMKGVAPPEVSMGDIYRSILPFIAPQLIGVLAVLFFPQLVLWLPDAIFGLQ
ncbi:hypothetical protein M1O56_05870 [Dehalococcoidia bacterium]|nr:hypothetical protein [Dehalococcoidia bacterium]